MSSNALYGEIPGDAFPPDSKLRELNVARNKLRGTLPDGVSLIPFTEFDVSHNKIGGTIKCTGNSTSTSPLSIDFSVNRISGSICDHILDHVVTIDILQGNLYSCESFHYLKDALIADPYYNKYTCGSEGIDMSEFTFHL